MTSSVYCIRFSGKYCANTKEYSLQIIRTKKLSLAVLMYYTYADIIIIFIIYICVYTQSHTMFMDFPPGHNLSSSMFIQSCHVFPWRAYP